MQGGHHFLHLIKQTLL